MWVNDWKIKMIGKNREESELERNWQQSVTVMKSKEKSQIKIRTSYRYEEDHNWKRYMRD